MVRGSKQRRGFTLIEILIVMTLLVSFGYLVFSLMRGSLELWRKGEAGRDLNEKAAAIFDVLVRDLEALHVGKEGKLLSEIALEDARGNAKPEGVSRRVRFVRNAGRAEESAVLRRSLPPAGQSTTQSTEKEDLPIGTGLFEVAVVSRKDPRQANPAVQVLYRSIRPVGDPASPTIFAEQYFEKKENWGESLKELSSGVLYFGMAFGGENLRSWEDEDESIPSRYGMPEHVWDSTRGILGKKEELAANQFTLARGPESLQDSRDDVFPKKILLTVVLDRDSNESRLTFLREELDEEEKRIEVDDPKRLPTRFPAYIKIEQEWIEIASVEGKTAIAKRRGARSTVQTSHVAGTKIHVGESFRTELRLPQNREDWNAAKQ